MAELVGMMQVAGTVMNVAGSLFGANNERKALDAQALQMDQMANATQATAQREAMEQRRIARLAQSRLQALAQGGGSDTSIVNLSADIAAEGEYRALSAMYEGDERAAGIRYGADLKRYEGKQAQRAGQIGAITSLISKGPGLFEKYGGGGPSDYGTDKYSRTGDDIRGRR